MPKIIVNGTEWDTPASELSYDDIVRVAPCNAPRSSEVARSKVGKALAAKWKASGATC